VNHNLPSKAGLQEYIVEFIVHEDEVHCTSHDLNYYFMAHVLTLSRHSVLLRVTLSKQSLNINVLKQRIVRYLIVRLYADSYPVIM